MKVGHKLVFGFLGLTLLIAGLGYVCLQTSQTALEQSIGKSASDLSEQILDNIDKNIHRRIEQAQVYATDELARKCISISNSQFEKMADPNSYIAQTDKDWVSGFELPNISELTHNELAKELQAQQLFYLGKYGYPLLAEIFVTNRFGVNVAQTNKTTDYYQADEEWWQAARKDGLFVGDVNCDESTGTFSTEIAVRIDDANGNFAGIIKVVQNIKETIDTLNAAKLSAEYTTIQLHLIDRHGKIVYSTRDSKLGQDEAGRLGNDFANADSTKQKLYMIDKNGQLLTMTQTKKSGRFAGLGWTLITETDTAEIFAPITVLRNTMLLAGLVILGLALLASSITYRSVVVPIAELQQATIQIASGNLDTNLTKAGSGQVNQLVNSFQRMAERLKITISDLNDEINGRKKIEEELRENESRLRTILDNVQTSVFIIDPDTHIIIYANKIAARLTGVPQEQLIDSKCHKYICSAEEGRCPITDLGQHIDNSERILLTAEGEKCPIRKTAATIIFNGKKHILESFVDLSEHKKTEQKLERLNKDLENAVGELSRSNRQLHDFMHVAAHDLKTPVRGIGTLADWIINDYGDKLDNQGREQIRLLKKRVVRIDKLIDGMLQFSKIVRTKHKERQVNLNAILDDIKNNIDSSGHIEIAVDSMPAITGEYEHIELIFQNLLTNAVTFMDKTKGMVKVGCVELGDFWKFYVCDNGPGIEQKYYDKIFRIFQTLPKNDEPATAGIGLAIVKKIVELYCGKIWVESQPGSGSTFYFTFPKQIEEISYETAKTNTAC